MSRISAHRSSRAAGFTLVEVMVASSLAAIVIAATLAAYLFVGRNLTRLINTQQQESKGRRALQWFTKDLSSAISLTTSTDTQIVLTMPTAGANATVTYTYTAGSGTLTRNDSSTGATTTLLTDLTAFDFNYYDEPGNSVTSKPQSVKAVEFSFTSVVGTSLGGTRATYTTVSPRVVLRNKQALQ